MTTFVLVHGAWHTGAAWDRVTPLLDTDAIAPDLTLDRDIGLSTHVDEVIAAIDATTGDLVLAGHSYAGLVIRQAADARPERVSHLVLIDGWAGPDGASVASLAPDWLMTSVRTAAGDSWRIPAPDAATFGITDPADARLLTLHDHPLRTFTEPTRLTGAVDEIPGTAVYCRPEVMPFRRLAEDLGYRTIAVDGPHDVMLTDPKTVAEVLLRCC
jgi:pimeloyl-ACP methyl ester carboxylesterase